MITYFTSDFHLNHKNIIKYSNRPFSNVHEMNETIIKNWNSKITKDDYTYFLGDYAFSNVEFITQTLSRLNGKIFIIFGNHDRPMRQLAKGINGNTHLSDKIKFLGDYYEIMIDNQPIMLCHYPMIVWNRKSHGSWCLSGHSHYNLKATHKENKVFGKVLDVGVDGNNFMPYSFNDLVVIMKNKPIISGYDELIDHHGRK